jgi:hypothetical protein
MTHDYQCDYPAFVCTCEVPDFKLITLCPSGKVEPTTGVAYGGPGAAAQNMSIAVPHSPEPKLAVLSPRDKDMRLVYLEDCTGHERAIDALVQADLAKLAKAGPRFNRHGDLMPRWLCALRWYDAVAFIVFLAIIVGLLFLINASGQEQTAQIHDAKVAACDAHNRSVREQRVVMRYIYYGKPPRLTPLMDCARIAP